MEWAVINPIIHVQSGIILGLVLLDMLILSHLIYDRLGCGFVLVRSIQLAPTSPLIVVSQCNPLLLVVSPSAYPYQS